MQSSPQFDKYLWFTVGESCEGRHYVLGNPHTFPGRMLGWCPNKQTSFCFSKSEVDDAAPETRAWIEGFLAGSETEPPFNTDGDVDFDSPKYKKWLEDMRDFRLSGDLATSNRLPAKQQRSPLWRRNFFKNQRFWLLKKF